MMAAYPNGRIPPSLLKPVRNFVPLTSSVNAKGGSDRLRADAQAALDLLQDEFERVVGRPLNVSEAYRSRELQESYWDLFIRGIGNLAAVPGTSNHGWGVSCDFGSGVGVYGSVAKAWMDANAPRYGWQPTGNKFARREGWHYDFMPDTATETIPASGGASPFPDREEDDMTPDQSNQLTEAWRASAVAKDNSVAALAEVKAAREQLDLITAILATDKDDSGIPGGLRGLIRDIRLNAYLAKASSGNAETIAAQTRSWVESVKKKLGV